MNHMTPKLRAIEDTGSVREETCNMLGAIRDSLAILAAITEGGLLDALPELESDQNRHQTGVTMLALLEDRLRQSVGNPDHPISGECRCDGRQHCGPRE